MIIENELDLINNMEYIYYFRRNIKKIINRNKLDLPYEKTYDIIRRKK